MAAAFFPTAPRENTTINPLAPQQLSSSQANDNVPSVQMLSDLHFGDWQYNALKDFLENYTPQSSVLDVLQRRQTITRQEFAIALQALIAQIIEHKQVIPAKDLAILKALQNAFQLELSTLTQRLDTASQELKTQEQQQFSTTTKLEGEVLFSSFAIGGDPVETEEEIGDRRITFGYRARLNLITSFSGRDRLRIRLQSSSTGEVDEATGSDMTRPSFQSNTGVIGSMR